MYSDLMNCMLTVLELCWERESQARPGITAVYSLAVFFSCKLNGVQRTAIIYKKILIKKELGDFLRWKGFLFFFLLFTLYAFLVLYCCYYGYCHCRRSCDDVILERFTRLLVDNIWESWITVCCIFRGLNC